MANRKFSSGVLKINDKKTNIFLSFHPGNLDSYKYEAIFISLPRINGLKSSRKRAEAAYDMVVALENAGFVIKKKPK